MFLIKSKYLFFGLLSLLILGGTFSPFLAEVAFSADPSPRGIWSNGLVPCGRGEAGPEDCTLGSLLTLASNFLSFLLWVATLAATAVIIYTGSTMAFYASTNPGKASGAKKMLYNVVIGYFVVLIAWLVVKELLGFFAGDSGPLREAINRVFNASGS